jgi:endonuclease/exonuclease/phosphatase (EEP) superfamily protein YafD
MGFELTSHFRVQYFWIFLIAAIVYGCKKKWKLLLAAVCFLIINGLVIAPGYLSEAVGKTFSNSHSLRILFSNVHTSNKNYASLLSLIDKESPDIIALQEIDDNWVRTIKSLCSEYPFYEFCPRRDNFGIAVLSKVSLQNIQVKSFCKTMVPSIVADVAIQESNFRLIITHPVPPASPGYYSMRNEQLGQIAEYVKNETRPCVIVGDLNLTMWSYYHEKLLEETGMKNARIGFGIFPTWPTILPPLYIPLDHCLCSSDIQVKSFRTTDRIGSDHLPFVVDLMLPKKH